MARKARTQYYRHETITRMQRMMETENLAAVMRESEKLPAWLRAVFVEFVIVSRMDAAKGAGRTVAKPVRLPLTPEGA